LRQANANICTRHACPRRVCHMRLSDYLVSFQYWRLFQWTCVNAHFPIPSNVTAMVARAGHMDTMPWLHRHGYISHSSVDVCYAAAEHGHQHIVEWCIHGCSMRPNRRMLVSAAASGRLKLVKWLHGQGCRPSVDIIHMAARHGHLHIVQWVDAFGYLWTWPIYGEIVRGGHLHVIKWAAQTKGCHWDGIKLDQLVQYAVDWKVRGIDFAAVLDWFIERGCQASRGVMRTVICAGDLDIVKWFHARGFHLDCVRCMQYSNTYRGRKDIYEWLRDLHDMQS